MIRSNLHTHTTYSDGRDTPEEMVKAALSRGFVSLGISDHCFTPTCPELGIQPGKFEEYAGEVRRLKAAYAGKINVYLGLENEALSPWPADKLDYVIGSVHDVALDPEQTLCVDSSTPKFKDGLRYLGGDERRLVRLYYQAIANMIRTQKPDIVGHFDLLTKYNAQNDLFDANSDWYRETALQAVDILAASGLVMELNTGAMSRGLKNEPYPAPWLLFECRKRGVPVTVSSDCHCTDDIDGYFDDMERLLRDTGYTEVWEFNGTGFNALKL